MDEKVAEEKLHKNTQRVTGIAALRKIRILVDSFEVQEKKNKKRSIVLLIITLLTCLCFSYYVLNHEPSLENINTSKAGSIVSLIRFVFVLA